jgi:DNA-binding MarR family transcriptional regulator
MLCDVSTTRRTIGSMGNESPWLTEKQQRVWREWLAMNARLPAALHRQLQNDSGLSLQDFDVLVRLTDTTEGRVRILPLANALGWERSRLSHHVKRMEGRGLVEREECVDDGRGAFVVLTEQGRAAIERAAPGHARTVRQLMFDQLNDDEVDTLGAVLDTVLTQLSQRAVPHKPA